MHLTILSINIFSPKVSSDITEGFMPKIPSSGKGAAIKKYAALTASSDTPPITLGLLSSNSYLVSLVPSTFSVELSTCCILPFKFWTVPTLPSPSIPLSLVDIWMFIASLYWPLGTILSSRSLFILAPEKLFLISGIVI